MYIGLNKKFNILFFEYFTPKNDLSTKRKSKKPTISSGNEIEQWHKKRDGLFD